MYPTSWLEPSAICNKGRNMAKPKPSNTPTNKLSVSEIKDSIL